MNTKNIISLVITLIVIFVGGYFLVTKKPAPTGDSLDTPDTSRIHYNCQEGSIDAIYKESSVTLTLSGSRILDLPQGISASGLRYEKDGVVFVSKGDNASLEEEGKTTYQNCVAGNVSNSNTKGISVFTDQGKTITFSYPNSFSVSGGGIGYTQDWRANAKGSGVILAKATLPKSSEPQTNFSEAVLTIGTSSDTKDVQNCLNTSNGEQIGVGVKKIDGAPYAKFISSEGAAGNFYETTSYRTIRGGQCYALEYTIHSTNIGNYSPDQGIKEFDKQKVVGQVESIIDSFHFLKNTAQQSDSAIKSSIKMVSVVPLSVVEDSRCHVGVQCVWSGTVKVKVKVTSGSATAEDTVTLGQPKTIAGVSVTLVSVSPEATDKVLAFSDYKFEFATN